MDSKIDQTRDTPQAAIDHSLNSLEDVTEAWSASPNAPIAQKSAKFDLSDLDPFAADSESPFKDIVSLGLPTKPEILEQNEQNTVNSPEQPSTPSLNRTLGDLLDPKSSSTSLLHILPASEDSDDSPSPDTEKQFAIAMMKAQEIDSQAEGKDNNSFTKKMKSFTMPFNSNGSASSSSASSPKLQTEGGNPVLSLQGFLKSNDTTPKSSRSPSPSQRRSANTLHEKKPSENFAKQHLMEKNSLGDEYNEKQQSFDVDESLGRNMTKLEIGPSRIDSESEQAPVAEKGLLVADTSERDQEVPFNFNKFLEQMKEPSADPVAQYLRSFLKGYAKRPPPTINSQTRVINDFLVFIEGKMRMCAPWTNLLRDSKNQSEKDIENLVKTQGQKEFEMSCEAMEKLVMNRLWQFTFSPALDLSNFPTNHAPSDDIERDVILRQRIMLFGWLRSKHLELDFGEGVIELDSGVEVEKVISGDQEKTSLGDGGTSLPSSRADTPEQTPTRKGKSKRSPAELTVYYLEHAKIELLKMNDYKAPRDKCVCLLNCSKLVFALIRHLSTTKQTEQGADAFIPLLIYVLLKANPDHLISNLQYIQRFRNPEKLQGETGYYISSLSAAVSFIEGIDVSHLSSITQEEFESNIETAIKNLPDDIGEATVERRLRDKRPNMSPPLLNINASQNYKVPDSELESPTALRQPGFFKEPSRNKPHNTNSSFNPFESTRSFFIKGSDSVERIVSKPVRAISKILDDLEQSFTPSESQTPSHQYPSVQRSPSGRRTYSHQYPQGVVPGSQAYDQASYTPHPGPYRQEYVPHHSHHLQSSQHPHHGMYVPDGMSVEEVSREIERQGQAERSAALQTLEGIFPGHDKDVLEMVLIENSGDVSKTIESLLDMQS